MNTFKSTLFITLSLALCSIGTIMAQQPKTNLNKKEARVVIDSISNKLKGNYIFPEIADKMVAKMKDNLKKGAYKSIHNHQEFATTLTKDLQAVSKDKHLRVLYDPARIAAQQKVVTSADSINYQNKRIANMKRNNFGFKEVSILDGNIGYLDLRGFSDTEYAGETAVAAMNFLSNTNAMIIDLRKNGGGSPEMIQLITSYLYGAEPVHLNNFYWRPTDTHSQTWTLPHVQGKRSPKTPVYILTSNRTFSAAEEFCYNLKNLKRATLIGETTGGGAHPGGPVNATDNFMVWVPTGRAINPITKTNWEGIGVSPDIDVKSEKALTVAQIKALESLSEKTADTGMKQFYDWHLNGLKIKADPVTITNEKLKSYIGSFGPRKISMEGHTLFYQRGEGVKYELLPLSQQEFLLKGLSRFRIKFISENGKVVALEGNYDNGRSDKSLKSKS